MTASRLRRSTSMMLLVALQLSMAASGFQIKRPQTIANNGSLRFSSTTTTTTTTRSSSPLYSAPPGGATPQEEQAVADFKMITEEESQLRKTGGIVLAVITIVAFFFVPEKGDGAGHYYDYTNLCSGAFAALGTYRSGAEYQ